MSFLSFVLLVLPGLVVAYALFARPLLRAEFKEFYQTADGFWAKVWALCGKSVTMAWGHVLWFLGVLLQLADPIAAFLGDPDFRVQLTSTLEANPKVLGYVLMGISAVTLIARMHGLLKHVDEGERQ